VQSAGRGTPRRLVRVQPIGDEAAVLQANRAFYDAFEARDIDAMSEVWEHSDRVCCTHPGWGRLEGWGVVAASFLALFQGPQPIQFILTNEAVEVVGQLAWVSVDENILGDDAGATASGLNLFARTSDGWRMVVHHSSQVMAG
jgi:ketosteroid isomerase-like protein